MIVYDIINITPIPELRPTPPYFEPQQAGRAPRMPFLAEVDYTITLAGSHFPYGYTRTALVRRISQAHDSINTVPTMTRDFKVGLTTAPETRPGRMRPTDRIPLVDAVTCFLKAPIAVAAPDAHHVLGILETYLTPALINTLELPNPDTGKNKA